ncbi:MAG TPA: OsmC family protein [Vicinamibacterales bacterium]|nr:OsmC family protein [Vicinamibacterales bacterium]
MTSTVSLRTHGGATTVAGADGLAVTIDGRPEVSEQLLGLAVAGCYANTLLAEAAGRGVQIRDLSVRVEIEWFDTPARTRSVAVHIEIAADADEPTVMELVEHADRVSAVANAIRLEVPVHVADVRAPQPV